MRETGTKAFTSYIEACKEMRCIFIFRFSPPLALTLSDIFLPPPFTEDA